jgi:hypothetical protein
MVALPDRVNHEVSIDSNGSQVLVRVDNGTLTDKSIFSININLMSDTNSVIGTEADCKQAIVANLHDDAIKFGNDMVGKRIFGQSIAA